MTKKRFSKLLSVILALAICATTVFGCLITANAATPCYAWSDGKVADDGQTATINLTITAPDLLADYGFQSGSFTLTQDTALTIDGVEAASGTQKNGSTDVSDIEVTPDENGSYLFGSNSFYSEVVFKITYKASFEKGKEYKVNVTSMKLANSWDIYPEKASGKAGVIKWGCDHVVSVVGLTPVATGNGYSVYENAVCAKCGENIGYQLVPTESLKTEPNVIYNNGTYDRSFLDNAAEGVGDTAENPYIIKTVAQLHALVRGSTYEKVTGKYFKIDNGIDIICLQPYGYFSDVNEFLTKDSSETKTYLEQPTQNGKGRQIWWSGISNEYTEGGCAGTIPFDGHLDFNGATVMGMYNTQGGLFAEVGPNATFKNVSLKNLYSYNEAGPAGTIAGYANSYKYTDADSTEQTVANGNLEAENIEISNCYVNSKDSKNNNFVGALIGRFRCIDGKIGVHINNCFAYNNTVLYNTEDRACLLGAVLNTFKSSAEDAETGGAYIKIENTVTIGITPYHALAETNSGQSTAPEHFENVYSDKYDENLFAITSESWNWITAASYKGKLEKITTYQASGLNALDLNGLDFVNTWHFDSNGGYPSPVKTEDVQAVSQSALNLKAVNLTYATDGTFDINFYYEPVEALANIITTETTKVYAGVADGSALYESQGVVVSDADCETLGLKSGALCYSVKSIPARKIGDLILPTVVAKNVGTTIWGATKQLSVADYAKAVIDGDGIYYPDNATEEQKAQDKAVAAAVINYGTAAKNALAVTSADSATDVVYYKGGASEEPSLLDDTKANSEENPYIISKPEHLLYIAKEGAADTAGRYYKVDDTVKAFVLQTSDRVTKAGGLNKLMNLDKSGVMGMFDDPNKTVTYNPSDEYVSHSASRTVNGVEWQNWNKDADANKSFQGTFDGNGVTIYGLYSNSPTMGLFGYVKGATIKNINIKSSYAVGYEGGLIATRTGGSDDATITNSFENCTITNSCVLTCRAKKTGAIGESDAYVSAGVLVGHTNNNLTSISNCLVADVVAYHYGYDGREISKTTGKTVSDIYDWATLGNTLGFVGNRLNNIANRNKNINNSIILGVTPYMSVKHNFAYSAADPAIFSNVYTDMPTTDVAFANETKDYSESQIKNISVDNIKDEAETKHSTCNNLDWNNDWITGYPGSYPTPAQKGITTDTALNVIYGVGEPDGTFMDGSHGTGKESDPYIISTAAQLRALVQGNTDNTKVANTRGKYFKIADGIDIICLQNSSYIGDIHEFLAKSADEVKTFLSNDTNRSRWQASGGPFDGTLDFNGATIVGLYNENGGLFADVGPNANLKNFKIKNSYITTGWYAGTIFGRALPYRYKSTDEDAKDVYKYVTEGTVVIENAEVSNCFVETKAGNDTAQNVGAMFGMTYQPSGSTDPLSASVCGMTAKIGVSVENAILYGNKAMHYNTASKNYNERNCLMGSVLTNLKQAEETENLYYQFDKIIAIDCLPYMANANNTQAMVTDENNFTNVYTNKFGTNDVKPYYHESSKSVNSSDYATKTDATYDGHINQISADDIKGANAKTVMANLGWAEDGSGAWYTGNAWGYPSFEKASVMPEAYQSAYDNLALDSYITYGDSTAQFGLYAGAVNLMTNPSIGFTFAFADNYKANRDKINIKITNADGTVTYYRGNPPAYDGSEIVNQNGWTNKTKAGRYHLLKLDGSVGTVVAAKDLCNDVKITMEYNGKTVNATFNLKGLAKEYEDAYKLTGSNYYLVRAEAVKAVIYYSQMLDARY